MCTGVIIYDVVCVCAARDSGCILGASRQDSGSSEGNVHLHQVPHHPPCLGKVHVSSDQGKQLFQQARYACCIGARLSSCGGDINHFSTYHCIPGVALAWLERYLTCFRSISIDCMYKLQLLVVILPDKNLSQSIRRLTGFICFGHSPHAMSAGDAVYPSEKERIFGQKAKVTARLADKAARRSQALALSYSVSMVASYLLIWADSLARSQLS